MGGSVWLGGWYEDLGRVELEREGFWGAWTLLVDEAMFGGEVDGAVEGSNKPTIPCACDTMVLCGRARAKGGWVELGCCGGGRSGWFLCGGHWRDVDAADVDAVDVEDSLDEP